MYAANPVGTFEVLWSTETHKRGGIFSVANKRRKVKTLIEAMDLAKGAQLCPATNLFFVHIPKTGGGTVEQSICPMEHRYSTKLRIATELGYANVNHKASHMLLDENRRLSSDGLKGAVTFAMLRNPYDRFVSEANYRKECYSLQQQIEVCKNATLNADHDHFSHCRPQTDYVGINGDKVDHLFLMFDGMQEFLLKHGYQLANLSVGSHVSVKRWSAADLTAEQREWIERVYAADFALLRSKFQYVAAVDAYTLYNREIDMHVVAFYIVVASVWVIWRGGRRSRR